MTQEAKAWSMACLLFGILLALGLVPGMVQPAYAETGAYTNLVPTSSEHGDALAGKQVTFNGHRWYIIQDNSSSAMEGYVTLLAADTSFDRRQWGVGGATDYNTSWAKSSLDGLVNSSSFKYVADTMKDTGNGKLYLLSIDEANAVPSNVRALQFEPGPWPHPFEAEGPWWLREKGPGNETVSFVRGTTGEINVIQGISPAGLNASWNLGIRPAMQLDLHYVLFDFRTKTFNLKPYYDHMLTPNVSEEELAGKQVNFNGRKWYLIDEKGVTDSKHGTVTLLAADDSFGTSAFGESDNYASSTVKSCLDALTATDGAFEKVAKAMVTTDNGKMYLLSKEEAEALPASVRKSGPHAQWWLRSGGADGKAAYVEASSGSVNSNGSVGSSYGVRPVVQLDLSEAMYVSSVKAFTLATYTNLIPTGSEDGDALAAKKVYFHKRPWYVIEDKSADPNQPYVKLLAADTSFG
ncbi:MAG: hypothetical protein IJ087_07025 [Eggerthellaceae bacterium]|nr:hypothetical protein [Eggerthellaceae bacterium]